MEAKLFRDDEVEILIDLIHAYPPLYCQNHEGYRRNGLKAAIWKNIAESLGKDVKVCKTKWRHLRNYYWRRKHQGRLTSGTSSSILRRHQMMQFLEVSDPRLCFTVGGSDISHKLIIIKDIGVEREKNGALEGSPSPMQPHSSNSRSLQTRMLMEHQDHSNGIPLPATIASAFGDYNSNKCQANNRQIPGEECKPEMPQGVVDFFAKASSGASHFGADKVSQGGGLFSHQQRKAGVELAADPAENNLKPLLQRLMSNPALSVERIEKQQRSVTLQSETVAVKESLTQIKKQTRIIME